MQQLPLLPLLQPRLQVRALERRGSTLRADSAPPRQNSTARKAPRPAPQPMFAREAAQAKHYSAGSTSKPQPDRRTRAASRRRCAGAERDCRAKRARPLLPARARTSIVALSRDSLPLCDYGNGNVVCQLTLRAHVPERVLARPRGPSLNTSFVVLICRTVRARLLTC